MGARARHEWGRALPIVVDGLKFEGVVAAGIGKHSELIVPGRVVLREPPHDWPEVLFPGSLNVAWKSIQRRLDGTDC